MYNPGGAFLAPPQAKLEGAYRQELWDAHGLLFSSLLALNNMPIKRWADHLLRRRAPPGLGLGLGLPIKRWAGHPLRRRAPPGGRVCVVGGWVAVCQT